MYTPSTDELQQIIHIVQQIMNRRAYVLQGYVTSVNPKPPYTVKVMLEPYETETGWLPVQTNYATSHGGLVLPPPDEGTPVTVIFDMADPSQGKVIAMQWNDQVPMPSVTAGDMGLFNKNGAFLKIGQDGSVSLLNEGGYGITVSKSGQVTIKGATNTQTW